MHYLHMSPCSRMYKVLQSYVTTKKLIEHARMDQMAQQTKTGLQKRNQHCDITEENCKS